MKHWPHFHRCQSLNSVLSWLVEVGLASTRWFLAFIWLKPDSVWPGLSSMEKFLGQGEWGKTMERGSTADRGLPVLLKGCRVSCLDMASITVVGTFTVGRNKKRVINFVFSSISFQLNLVGKLAWIQSAIVFKPALQIKTNVNNLPTMNRKRGGKQTHFFVTHIKNIQCSPYVF